VVVPVAAWFAHYSPGGTDPVDLDRTGTPFWKKILEMKCEEATRVYVLTLFAEGVINRWRKTVVKCGCWVVKIESGVEVMRRIYSFN
jgi:hypothetical protein